MRATLILLTILFLLFTSPPTPAAAPDGIELTITRGPGPTSVTLVWTGDVSSYGVYRSQNPTTIRNPNNRITTTSANSFVDTTPNTAIYYYLVEGDCPTGERVCYGTCSPDTDDDGFCDNVDNCADKPNPGQANQDGDAAGDLCDYCISDPAKIERGRCGCFSPEDVDDEDLDGVIDCHDQCPGIDDAVDADRGGLPDACDPCPTGLCETVLPERFYAELPAHQAKHVSRDGRWIAAIEIATSRGFLIPTEQLVANPSDTSYYEPMGDERVLEIRGFSDDNNIVLATIETRVPQSNSSIWASALYDRTNGNWTVLGLYDDGIDIDACRFYPNGGDLSSDGKLVFGRTPIVENPCALKAFRYDVASEEWLLFAGPEGAVRLVEGASGDGGRIVGSENRYIGGGGETGVIWTYEPPDVYSSQWVGEASVAYDVTFDGSVASVMSEGKAYRWTESGGLQLLASGTLDVGMIALPVAISDGGNIVVGYHIDGLFVGLPFIWVEGLGQIGNLRDYLIYRGFAAEDLGQFSNSYAPFDTSTDGRIIVGKGGGAFTGLPGWVVITPHE